MKLICSPIQISSIHTEFAKICSLKLFTAIHISWWFEAGLQSESIETKQNCYRSAGQVGESTYQIWRKSLQTVPRDQNFVLIFSFFSSSFCKLCKICHKTRMRAPIGLKFGTRKWLIKADLSTNFGRNLMNMHRVMTNYLCKIRSKVCHAHRVNPLKEWAENAV